MRTYIFLPTQCEDIILSIFSEKKKGKLIQNSTFESVFKFLDIVL